MNFLVDNQLPRALSNFLTSRGHNSVHVLDLGIDEKSDLEIWYYALYRYLIVVSKDEDFLHLGNRAEDTGKLLWVRIGNCRTRRLIEAFEKDLPMVVQAFQNGARIVEIR